MNHLSFFIDGGSRLLRKPARLPLLSQGAGTLTLVGTMTGRIYRWSGKGIVQAVDYRDAGGLMHGNQLRRVK